MLELFRSPRRTVVWFVEASLLVGLVVAAAAMRLGWESALESDKFAGALMVSAVAQGSLYYHGLYGRRPESKLSLVVLFLRALAVAAAVLWVFFRLVPDARLGEIVCAAALGGAAIVLPAFRIAFQRVAGSNSFRKPALVLGSGDLAEACASLLQSEDEDHGLRLVGRVVREEEALDGPSVIGRYADLLRLVDEHRVGAIIVACRDRRGTLPVGVLLELKFRGVHIEEGVDFYERATGKMYVLDLKPSKIIFSRGFMVRRRTLVLKRGFDVVCAAVGLVLATPLMLLAALAVKIDSPGPVLYSQVRSGLFGRPFLVRKFRSMRTDAEANGAVWAAENDSRVTRVGSFLRKSRIDELPQLWNVLIGEMSMVGPRPERPIFVAQLEQQIPFFRQRLCVKPGVTGHAQVRCRYGASAEDALEKLQYDLFYMKSFSVWFDVSILVDTVKVVLLRIGAR